MISVEHGIESDVVIRYGESELRLTAQQLEQLVADAFRVMADFDFQFNCPIAEQCSIVRSQVEKAYNRGLVDGSDSVREKKA